MLRTDQGKLHIVFLAVLIALVTVIGVANFRPGTWFLGWDALSPELNIPANTERALFAAWQGNEGLGLLGGHGYAGTLPHTLFINALMMVLPQHVVRYVFTILMLLVGVIGAYALGNRVTKHPAAAFLGSLFYLLNFGTVQLFSLQLEAFIIHYAALPWIILTLMNYVERPSAGTLTVHAAVWFLAMTQGFIPPVFLVAYMVQLILVVGYMLKKTGRPVTKTLGIALVLPILANILWLPTFLYYTVTQTNVVLSAFNTLWSTPQFIGQSLKYGSLGEVSLLRGLYYDSVATIVNNVPVYVFEPWKRHFSIPGMTIIGYLWFAVACAGAVVAFIKPKHPSERMLSLLFLLLFAGLAKAIPGFREINMLLERLPLISQAFRTPFTKLIVAFALSASLLSAVAFTEFFRHIREHKPAVGLFTVIATLTLVFFALPVFRGDAFYRALMVQMPEAYTNLIAYFETQDPSDRILVLPQDCAEGWTSYSWGYAGSGFLHYGVKQPIMDRAFDVWSRTNENSYWELTQILKSRNYGALEQYLAKYGVAWVVYDPNIGHCSGARGFQHLLDLPDYLIKSGFVQPVKSFPAPGIQTIGLYRVAGYSGPVQSFTTIPNIAPQYDWIDDDTAFTDAGAYVTNPDKQPDSYYPFRSLFTKRGTPDANTLLTEDDETVNVETVLRSQIPGGIINLPQYLTHETVVPASLAIASTSGTIDLRLSLPSLYADGVAVLSVIPQTTLSRGAPAQISRITVEDRILDVRNTDGETVSDPFMVSISNPTTITISGAQGGIRQTVTIEPSMVLDLLSVIPDHVLLPDHTARLTVRIPKIAVPQVSGTLGADEVFQPVACPEGSADPPLGIFSAFGTAMKRWATTRGSQCMLFAADRQPLSSGYMLSLPVKTVSGVPAAVRLTNTANKTPDVEFRLPPDAANPVRLLVPVMYSSGEGRTVTVKQTAIGTPSVSDIGIPSMYPIPYGFIKHITITGNAPAIPKAATFSCKALRKTETMAIAQCSQGETLGFLESFDPGWKAYAVPSTLINSPAYLLHILVPFTEKSLSGHSRLSGWANAWSLPQDGNRIILLLYVPELVQIAGISAGIIVFLFILFWTLR